MESNKININISCEYKYNQKLINWTFKDILNYYNDKTLKLDPEYQRDIVWNEDKMMSLIDSIIHGYYIPPLIINLNTDGKYICIDGKQRITSILNFMTNKIYYSINDNKIYFKDFDRFSEHTFYNRQIQVCYYENIDSDVELEIFRRVQKGEPMAKMELMKSYNPDLINELLKKTSDRIYKEFFRKYNIRQHRDYHLNYVLRAFMMECKKDKEFITLTLPEVEKFVKKYDNKDNYENEKSFYNNLEKLLNFLNDDKIFNDLQNTLTILDFILLYKITIDNKLIGYKNYYKNFLEYYNNKTNNSMSTYIPSILNDIYDNIKNNKDNNN